MQLNRMAFIAERIRAHLRLARQIWKERAQSAAPGIKLVGDLGSAVREAPENPAWLKIKLAIYSEDLSAESKKKIKVDRAANPALKDFDAYEEWHDAIDADDWSTATERYLPQDA